jgi:Ca2+-binding RTX toxin-like protein
MSQFIGDQPGATPNERGGVDLFADEATELPSDEPITGSGGPDQYTGTPGSPGATPSQVRNLNASEGNDIGQAGAGETANFAGEGGDDLLVGALGDDTLNGEGGDDTIQGGAGNDTISGGNGDDELFGNSGRDTLTGEAGDDTLDGGAGADTLTGGPGADTFTFELAQDGTEQAAENDFNTASDVFAGGEMDVITDFNAEEDTLQFDGEFFDDIDNFSVSEGSDGGTVVSYDGSEFLKLENVDPEDIDPNDFEIL